MKPSHHDSGWKKCCYYTGEMMRFCKKINRYNLLWGVRRGRCWVGDSKKKGPIGCGKAVVEHRRWQVGRRAMCCLPQWVCWAVSATKHGWITCGLKFAFAAYVFTQETSPKRASRKTDCAFLLLEHSTLN